MEKLVHPAMPVCNLDAALKRMGGDHDLLCDLISFYLEDYPALVDNSKKALKVDSWQETVSYAYTLKGLATNFDGYHVTAAATAFIEQATSQQATTGETTANQRRQLEYRIDHLAEQACQLADALRTAVKSRLICR